MIILIFSCMMLSVSTSSILILASVLLSVSTSSMHSCSPSSPLGMESGLILDYQVSATSSFAPSVGPDMGRLHSVEGGGAWCPATMVSNNTKEWLEVDLEKKMIITAISLQGRWDNGVGQEFSPFIVLMYYDDLTHQFVTYSDDDDNYVMTGNADTYSVAKILLDTPVVTARLRVIPYSYYQRSVCIRLDIHGCQAIQTRESEQVEVVTEAKDPKHPKLTIWILIPALIGVLLTCSILILVMTSCMYFRLKRSNKNRKELGDTAGVLYSDWFLQPSGQLYQDPSLNNIDERGELEIHDDYSVPQVSIEDPIYANPVDSNTSSASSPQSTLSSISTVFSSLEASSVGSLSATSTPRLGSHPSAFYQLKKFDDFEDNYYLSPIVLSSSSKEHIYSNIG